LLIVEKIATLERKKPADGCGLGEKMRID